MPHFPDDIQSIPTSFSSPEGGGIKDEVFSPYHARHFLLADRRGKYGPNPGEPHTEALGDGLFELRLKGAEGNAQP